MRFSNLYKMFLPALIVISLLVISCNNANKDTKPTTTSESSKDDSKDPGNAKSAGSQTVRVIDDTLNILYISVDVFKKKKTSVMFNFYIDNSGKLTLRGWTIPLKKDTAQAGGTATWDMTLGPSAGIAVQNDLHIGSMFLKNFKKIESSITATTKYIVFTPRIASGSFNRTLLYDISLSDTIPSFSLAQPNQTLMMLNPSPPYGFQ